MRMKLKGRKGDEILSFTDWESYGKPAKASHWIEGRSAWEMAREWTSGEGEQQVLALLKQRPELAEVAFVEGTVEAQTKFDRYPGGPRNHDLLIEATSTGSEPLVVSVEGKADEPFGLPLAEHCRRAESEAAAEGRRTNAPSRVRDLTELFFKTDMDASPELQGLGYQLLSALAGALAEAKDAEAPQAVLLVHEFRTPDTDPALHEANANDLDHLLRLLGVPIDPERDPDAWITAPRETDGDGELMGTRTKVHFAKLVTDRTAP